MSFGWSTGDLVSAIAIIAKTVKALDDVNGAAADFRGTVQFLRTLQRTLEPLQSLPRLCISSTLKHEILCEVNNIQVPVGLFVKRMEKFLPSLGHTGSKSSLGNVGRKLQWEYQVSKNAAKLESCVVKHLQILDTLLQRALLEAISNTHSILPQQLQEAVMSRIQPTIASAIQMHFLPFNAAISNQDQCITRQLDLFAQISRSHDEDRDNMKTFIREEIADLASQMKSQRGLNLGPTLVAADDRKVFTKQAINLALLMIWMEIQNIILRISRMFMKSPSRALSPSLEPRYEISFVDGIGRQRILPFEYFRSFKVFTAFLEDSFIGAPGAKWVDYGRYQIQNREGSTPITPQTWNFQVKPGSKLYMSMVLESEFSSGINFLDCPDYDCGGGLVKTNSLWSKCSRCGKGVQIIKDQQGNQLNTLIQQEQRRFNTQQHHSPIDCQLETSWKAGSVMQKTTLAEEVVHYNYQEVSHFKLITKQMHEVSQLPHINYNLFQQSALLQPNTESILWEEASRVNMLLFGYMNIGRHNVNNEDDIVFALNVIFEKRRDPEVGRILLLDNTETVVEVFKTIQLFAQMIGRASTCETSAEIIISATFAVLEYGRMMGTSLVKLFTLIRDMGSLLPFTSNDPLASGIEELPVRTLIDLYNAWIDLCIVTVDGFRATQFDDLQSRSRKSQNFIPQARAAVYAYARNETYGDSVLKADRTVVQDRLVKGFADRRRKLKEILSNVVGESI